MVISTNTTLMHPAVSTLTQKDPAHVEASVFRCQVCGRPFLTDTEMGQHLRIPGVNLFPEVIRLASLVQKITLNNRKLTLENEALKSRLRIIT